MKGKNFYRFRVEEALNFRKELRDLEISEMHRVQAINNEKKEKQRFDLQIRHAKELQQMKVKLQNEENKLIISIKKEYETLRKKIGII